MTNKIKHLTLTEKVASIIKEKIYRGEYLPGDRITESNLAKEFDISRGPIREALMKVEYEGLIECRSNRGCSVRVIDFNEIRDTYIIRNSLEKLAVNLWDRNDNINNTIDKMQRVVEHMEQASAEKDIGNLVKLDEEFHSLIILASNNKKLYEVWSILKNVNILTFLSTYNIDSFNFAKQGPGHQRIIDVLKNGTLKQIEQAITRHYDSSIQLFKNLEVK